MTTKDDSDRVLVCEGGRVVSDTWGVLAPPPDGDDPVQPETAARPEEYPSLAKQAGNFGGAVAGHLLSGAKRASDEEVERRLAICETCEAYDAKKERCRKCGCYLRGGALVRGKAAMAEQTCPLGKW